MNTYRHHERVTKLDVTIVRDEQGKTITRLDLGGSNFYASVPLGESDLALLRTARDKVLELQRQVEQAQIDMREIALDIVKESAAMNYTDHRGMKP